MTEPVVQAASRLAEAVALLAVGYNLRQSGILKPSDGETAIKLATTVTLPAAIVQALTTQGPLPLGPSCSLIGVATVCLGAQMAANWLYCMQRTKRERAVLTGSTTGLSLALLGYPLADCFLGAPAVAAVALVDLVNHLAVFVASYLFFAGAGPAFPDSFKHDDGGIYRGQWRGMRKEGLGVYTYASGARYEGEWRNNLKEGRGVYHFPKGGVYEGEWANGTMNGLGVRTFSTGQVKAGRWRGGTLVEPLELWQVALASDGATTVAAAARRVEVGGGRLQDALQQLAAQPTLWALLAGIAVNVAQTPMPASLDGVTWLLAQANTPLTLMAVGITAPAIGPAVLQQMASQRLLPDVSRLLGARLLLPLVVAASLLALAAGTAAGSGQAFAVAPGVLLPLCSALLLAFISPLPPQALQNARRFRLSETTAAALTTASYAVCVPLMLLSGAAACLAGLAAPPASAAAAAVSADIRPVLAFTAAALAAVAAAMSTAGNWSADGGPGATAAAAAAAAQPAQDPTVGRVLMVYSGPLATGAGEAGAQVPQGGTEGASAPSPAASAPQVGPGAAAGSGSSSGGSGGSGTGSEGAAGGEEGGAGGRQDRRPPPGAARAWGSGSGSCCGWLSSSSGSSRQALGAAGSCGVVLPGAVRGWYGSRAGSCGVAWRVRGPGQAARAGAGAGAGVCAAAVEGAVAGLASRPRSAGCVQAAVAGALRQGCGPCSSSSVAPRAIAAIRRGCRGVGGGVAFGRPFRALALVA